MNCDPAANSSPTDHPPSGVLGLGSCDRYLKQGEVRSLVRQGLSSLALHDRRLLVIIPDGTRTMPLPLMVDILEAEAGSRVAALDYLVALGTHQPMSDAQLSRLIGRQVADGQAGRSRIFNHRWEDPDTFATLGTIPAAEIRNLSGGLLERDVIVSLNKLIFNYDQILICGPVFPHEVVGFSGGNKYLFPGIAGSEIINFTHWLGAIITNYHVIGTSFTPVRAVIDRAAALIDRPVACLALVVTHGGMRGLYFGPSQHAWRAAADLSARTHIVYVERPFRRVLSIMPEMYDDLWTAAKGMYKLEPAVADGGEVVIYAPHITEVSYTHGSIIDEVGYHCRDYFLAHWQRFERYPGGVLAHSTHVKGLGSYNPSTCIETPRIQVTLATGIPEERCRRINLGYLNPAGIRIEEWAGRESEGVVVVPRAGEMLYRLKKNDEGRMAHEDG
ncbi:MAG: lactate racemase domain-containing protein [Acidobacteriia bacterium]|nr:lactate racemase domain-containing protein [Terriglobia bacterium]